MGLSKQPESQDKKHPVALLSDRDMDRIKVTYLIAWYESLRASKNNFCPRYDNYAVFDCPIISDTYLHRQ